MQIILIGVLPFVSLFVHKKCLDLSTYHCWCVCLSIILFCTDELVFWSFVDSAFAGGGRPLNLQAWTLLHLYTLLSFTLWRKFFVHFQPVSVFMFACYVGFSIKNEGEESIVPK